MQAPEVQNCEIILIAHSQLSGSLCSLPHGLPCPCTVCQEGWWDARLPDERLPTWALRASIGDKESRQCLVMGLQFMLRE